MLEMDINILLKIILSDIFTVVPIGSLLGKDKLMNEIQIKCIEPSSDVIGIMSEMNKRVIRTESGTAHNLVRQLNGYKYWYDLTCQR